MITPHEQKSHCENKSIGDDVGTGDLLNFTRKSNEEPHLFETLSPASVTPILQRMIDKYYRKPSRNCSSSFVSTYCSAQLHYPAVLPSFDMPARYFLLGHLSVKLFDDDVITEDFL